MTKLFWRLFGVAFVFMLTLPAWLPIASAGDFRFASAHGFALCSAADVGSTIAAVENGAMERNPLWRDSVNDRNYLPFVLGNIAVVALVYRFEDRIDPRALLFLNVTRCGIAGANLRFVF
jgi:hypothetical protein